MNFFIEQEFYLNFLNEQQVFYMNFWNNQQFLKLPRINKYLLRIFLNKQSRNISTNLWTKDACWWRCCVGE
jgi:hypothetical protein